MNKTTVVFATDKNYMYYTGVTLHSLIDNISPENEYVIVILHEELSATEQQFFHSLIKARNNVSLRLLDMSDWINKIGCENFFTRGRYPIAAYYRLFLPEILPDVDKVVYLDSDMLVRADIADLANTDLHGYALGAVKDKWIAGFFLAPEKRQLIKYCLKTLHMKSWRNYLNSGMLIMDLVKMREINFKQQVLACIAEGIQFLLVDQDIFNMIFENDYYAVESNWNDMMFESKRDHARSYIQHFSNLAPWVSPYKPYADLWRGYAKTGNVRYFAHIYD